MSDLVRSLAAETASLLRPQRSAEKLSKAHAQQLGPMALLFGLLLVSATIFTLLQAVEICSTSLKANFCP
jgi:hypothetical protein